MSKSKLFGIALFLLVSLTVFSALTLAAGVTIEFWTNETTEERVAVIENIVSEFESLHPQINVEVVPVHESDLPKRLSAAIATNRLPQVLQTGAEHVMRLGSEGLLDTEIAAEIIDELGRDDFFEGPLRLTSVEPGKNVSVPMHGWVQGIWYRKDWFEEAGLEAPTTWAAIQEAAKYFYDPDKRVYGIGIGTKKDQFSRQAFNQFAFSNNANMFAEDGSVVFDSPLMIATIAFYKQLASYGAPGPQNYRDGRALYMSDRAAMIVYSSFFMGTLSGNAPELIDKTAFAPVLKHADEAIYGQVVSLAVPKTASDAQKKAAKLLISYLMQGDAYIQYLHMAPAGMLPVRKSVANDASYREHELLARFGDQLDDIIAGLNAMKVFGFEHGKVFPEVGEIASRFIIGDAFARMIDNDWSAEQTAKWAQEKMTSVLR